jgi:hypothetical protein
MSAPNADIAANAQSRKWIFFIDSIILPNILHKSTRDRQLAKVCKRSSDSNNLPLEDLVADTAT